MHSPTIPSPFPTRYLYEVCKYNYSNPGFSMATGHFTQVIWKSTAYVGCARTTATSCPGGVTDPVSKRKWFSPVYMLTCEYDDPGKDNLDDAPQL